MLESHGDYRAEAPLEAHIGGTLYSQQNALPRLPIPTLRETIDRFLPTALPLASSDEEKDTLIKAAERFVTEAEGLQKRLEGRREEFKDSSWLQLWWNTLGYLQVDFDSLSPVLSSNNCFIINDLTFHKSSSTRSISQGTRPRSRQRFLLLPFLRRWYPPLRTSFHQITRSTPCILTTLLCSTVS